MTEIKEERKKTREVKEEKNEGRKAESNSKCPQGCGDSGPGNNVAWMCPDNWWPCFYSVTNRVLLFCYPMDWSPLGSSSVGFPQKEYWGGLSSPPPGNTPGPGTESVFPALLCWQAVLYYWVTLEAPVGDTTLEKCLSVLIDIGAYIYPMLWESYSKI